MAHWLSFCRMRVNWSCQRWLSRATALLGLLLVASLAHAGAACASTAGGEGPGLRAAASERCLAAVAPDVCIVVPQRIDVRVAAAASTPPSPAQLPAADGARYRASVLRTVAEPRPLAGLAPASPVPVYILLRRYLS